MKKGQHLPLTTHGILNVSGNSHDVILYFVLFRNSAHRSFFIQGLRSPCNVSRVS